MDAKQREAFDVSAYRWVSKCEDIIASWSDCADFALHKCTLHWSTRRRSSRGGWYATGPGINIAMALACRVRTDPYRMYEYASFDADPVIGGFYAKDTNLALGMIICHEMAHAVQFFRRKHLGHPRTKPHGIDFKAPYAKLRTEIINPLLNSEALYKEQYEAMIKETTKQLNHLFGVAA